MISIARQILDLGRRQRCAGRDRGSRLVPWREHGKAFARRKLCDRQLHVFDSFAGMPENSEAHGKSIYGREHHFPKGSHAVPFEEVKGNVARYGDASRAHFHKGFFSDTMPSFHEPVAAACVNVDLVQSTRDCFHYLYPLLPPGGIIISQDAHFPWIIELFNDDAFWEKRSA